MKANTKLSKVRLILGGLIFVSGFFSPFLVPSVTQTEWPIGLKTTISGLLIFGIPELFMIIAAAIAGKRGLSFLKDLLFRFFRSFLSRDVSKLQYRFGLFMVFFPLCIGLPYPYLQNSFQISLSTIIAISISLDLIMILGIFIAGEQFWRKVLALFSFDN